MKMRNSLEIIHRDENFIVVNKPPDVKINSDDKNDVTVATILADRFPLLVDQNVKHLFRFVHRLDYATSGCLCVALTQSAAGCASKAFRSRSVKKHYIALVRGHIKDEMMMIERGIGEDSNSPHKMCTDLSQNCLKPRQANTKLVLLETGFYGNEPASKVLLLPETGRRHQLRVHTCHIKHPIIGDYTYNMDSQPPRMMLHAIKLNIPGSILINTEDPFVDDWSVERVCMSLNEALFL